MANAQAFGAKLSFIGPVALQIVSSAPNPLAMLILLRPTLECGSLMKFYR
ncbi:MAG: hypothetical protein Rpha_1236 [Candidatus Ruthia sp. Apha_13_S6]|nr:hypothetical protein [Candidatus Ruthia sp. Apha_13_S6]